MGKKIEERGSKVRREELCNVCRVRRDVLFLSVFCYVIDGVRGKVGFELYGYEKGVV